MGEQKEKEDHPQAAPPRPYRTYVLRCSLADESLNGKARHWRFFIQDTVSPSRKKILSSLEGLTAYLHNELDDEESEM